MRKPQIFVYLSAAAILVALGIALSTPARRVVCESAGGRWAPAWDECIKPTCAATRTCGRWTTPRAFCDRVRPGDARDKVYFDLGMPDQETETHAVWIAGKLSSEQITAEFANGRLAEFSCPSLEQPASADSLAQP